MVYDHNFVASSLNEGDDKGPNNSELLKTKLHIYGAYIFLLLGVRHRHESGQKNVSLAKKTSGTKLKLPG